MRRAKIFRPFLAACLLVIWLAPAHGAGEAAPASMVIEDLHEALLTVMREAEELGFKGRFEKLEGPLGRAFDHERMIRVASGPFWRKATDEEKRDLLDAFRRMSLSTYAARFKSYKGHEFEIQGTRPGPQETALVSTRIVSSGSDPVEIVYVMKESDGQWRVADVLLENSISELAVRRSEYRAILKKDGVPGLIAALNQKAEDLRTDAN